MREERFFRDENMPFAEMRYSSGSMAIFKPHMHRTMSIGAVDRGSVRYCVGESEACLSPGSLAVINPEILHSCNPVSETGRSYYMLYLDTEWCCLVQQTLWEVESFIPSIKIKISDVDLYQHYCSVMEQLMDGSVLLQEKEQLLFDLVRNVFVQACDTPCKKTDVSGDIETLKRILSRDLQVDYPLNTLADELGINPYTLIRQFKKVTGITPHAYRMNCRIDMARRLLREGWDIAETAVECGFFDQSHLHRYFKAMTTVTPQDYRVNFIQ